MTKKPTGWQRESARHSLAARKVRTKGKGTPRDTHGAMTEVKNPLKEPPEEALESICCKLEEAALKETGEQQKAMELLADDDWMGAHIDELVATYELDNGLRSKLVARIRKRYSANGEQDGR